MQYAVSSPDEQEVEEKQLSWEKRPTHVSRPHGG